MENKRMFGEYLSGLGEIFNREITKTLSKVYWLCLQPFTDEQCKIAFNKALTTLKFFPKPVELIDLIPKPEEPNVLDAWAKVIRCLECGTKPRDINTCEVIRRLGGWDWLSTQTYDELIWVEKRFKEHFEVVIETANDKYLEYREVNLLNETQQKTERAN